MHILGLWRGYLLFQRTWLIRFVYVTTMCWILGLQFHLTSACMQIRLWESDLNRVIMKPAHFIEDFSSRVCISYSFFLNEYIYIFSDYDCWWIWQDVFDAACDFARECNGLLWENSKKMLLVVSGEIFPNVKDYIRRQVQ